jgi:hypothetical protein
MDAPICRSCGKKHWSRLCNADVAKPATVDVAATPVVAMKVYEGLTVTPEDVAAIVREVALLSAEVATLKRELAGKVAMTSTERSRKLRERRKKT